MDNELWDIFASGDDPQALWFGYQLARSAVQRGQPTRLFTDELDTLSNAVADLDPERWLQLHHGIEIADWRVAELSQVAPNAIQMLGTRLPAAYHARLVTSATPTRLVEVVAHDSEQAPATPLFKLDDTGRCTRLRIQFGDPPHKGGHIKSGRDTAALRALWTRPAMRQAMLQSLGLRPDVMDGKLSVFFDVRRETSIRPLMEALASGPREVCVFMDPRPLAWVVEQSALPWARRLEDSTRLLQYGALTLVELPSRRWYLTDDLILACDLVMTTEGDIAARACERGAPVLWSADDGGFFDWYAINSPPVMRRTIADAFNALATGHNAKWAWTCYLARWAEVRALADAVARRVRKAPDLVDVLVAGLRGDSDECLQRHFAPTAPGTELV